MDADENPYQAQLEQWDRFYRAVVVPQQHTLADVGDVDTGEITWSEAQLYDPEVNMALTDREEYSEVRTAVVSSDFETSSEKSSRIDCFDVGPDGKIRRTPSVETSPSELHVSNQMHNKYALSPETSAYARELSGIFDDAQFDNVDEPENLRHTGLRDFCKSSIEDLKVLPDPFPDKFQKKYSFD